jgi:curli biogenesis system outer membrane secretion channel CsgG
MKTTLLLVIFLTSFLIGNSQGLPVEKAVILAVEDDKVYLDLNENNASVGDRLQVIQDRGFFTHPVTGEQIQREPDIVAYIQITEVRSNYSIGSVSPRNAVSNLSVGMEAFMLEGKQRETREFRKSIAVQPMNVSSARGGYLGFYIADLLTEELFNIDKFKVIDRQTLGLQIDEIAMASQGIIDEREAIQLGRTRGVDYFITGTVYEPDVIDIGTGIPIKGILQTAEALSGQRLGSQYASDVRISQLRAIVNITLRVVDVQTGEILFIASEMQQSTGRSQIDLEQGALGGMQLQGGATSFLNTITGQATRAALVNLAGYINNYFEGKIDARNFKGNIIEVGRVGTRSDRVEGLNAQVILSTPIKERDAMGRQQFTINIDRGKSKGYKRGYTYPVIETFFQESNITGNMVSTGKKKIGNVKLSNVENDHSQGILKLKEGIRRPENSVFEHAQVNFLKYRPFSISGSFFINKNDISLGYRFDPNFGAGVKGGFGFKNKVHNDEFDRYSYVGVFGIGQIRLNRIFETYSNVGFVLHSEYTELRTRYVYYEWWDYYEWERNYTHSKVFPLIIDLGFRMYLVNWLSFDTQASILPVESIKVGFSMHLF